jgi:signal transduction histidine kinase
VALDSRIANDGLTVRLPRAWGALSLSTRYLVLVVAIAAVSAVAMGRWVSATIERAALEQHAGAAAMYMGQFVALLDEGRESAAPSPRAQRDLEAAIEGIGRRFGLAAIKIWSVDGRVLYASVSEVGEIYPTSSDVAAAAAGRVVVEFNAPTAESRAEFALFDALVEVYAPVRSSTGEVVAVVEFYVEDRRLAALLERARLQTWGITGALLALILVGPWVLVHDGSRTFARQRSELDSRISQLSSEIAQREQLRERVEHEARRTIEDNARVLRLIGSDLHDGPAQLISLALLRLDALDRDPQNTDVRTIRQALRESMNHIRSVSAGLLVEPGSRGNLRDEIARAVRVHETVTGTRVALDLADAPEECPTPVALCLRRVVQEGLANAVRHAGARGQSVRVARAPGGVLVEVSDQGPGIAPGDAVGDEPRLGLIGLRVRVESVGGVFVVAGAPGGGTRLTAQIPLEKG